MEIVVVGGGGWRQATIVVVGRASLGAKSIN